MVLYRVKLLGWKRKARKSSQVHHSNHQHQQPFRPTVSVNPWVVPQVSKVSSLALELRIAKVRRPRLLHLVFPVLAGSFRKRGLKICVTCDPLGRSLIPHVPANSHITGTGESEERIVSKLYIGTALIVLPAMEGSCAPTVGNSRSSMKEIDELTAWLQGISETDDWRPYQGSNEVQQCSHPDRTIRVEPLVRAAEIKVSSIPRRLQLPANQVFCPDQRKSSFSHQMSRTLQ
jgi:hypothetical protein